MPADTPAGTPAGTPGNDPDQVVTINVGGRSFSERRRILARSGYLDAMFRFHRGRTDFTAEFIGRDPEIFARLLNAMRDDNYLDPELARYRPDVVFFQLDFVTDYLVRLPDPRPRLLVEGTDPRCHLLRNEDGSLGFVLLPEKIPTGDQRWDTYTEVFPANITRYRLGCDLTIPTGFVGKLSLTDWAIGLFGDQNSVVLRPNRLSEGKHQNVTVILGVHHNNSWRSVHVPQNRQIIVLDLQRIPDVRLELVSVVDDATRERYLRHRAPDTQLYLNRV